MYQTRTVVLKVFDDRNTIIMIIIVCTVLGLVVFVVINHSSNSNSNVSCYYIRTIDIYRNTAVVVCSYVVVVVVYTLYFCFFVS